jgi:hydrogenase nickel incorporation protein HypA/HybF
MHELGITRSVIAACSERAAGARVARVTLEIGRLTCVSPDALRFCYDLCAEGTSLAGSRLEIIRIPGRARCRACDAEVVLDDLLTPCACGSHDLEIRAGEELRIKEMELASCAPPAAAPITAMPR